MPTPTHARDELDDFCDLVLNPPDTGFREFTFPLPDPDEELADAIARRVVLLLGDHLQPPPKAWLTTDEAAARLGIARSTLDRMLAAAPPDLPGHPTDLSEGRKRRHLRWDATRLQEWADAYHAWLRPPPKVKPAHRPKRAKPLREAPGEAVDWGAVGRGQDA